MLPVGDILTITYRQQQPPKQTKTNPRILSWFPSLPSLPFLFWFFKAGFLCAALAVLELALQVFLKLGDLPASAFSVLGLMCAVMPGLLHSLNGSGFGSITVRDVSRLHTSRAVVMQGLH